MKSTYQPFFEETSQNNSVELIETEDEFYLSDHSYHWHKKDIEAGMIPYEWGAFGRICEIMGITIDDLDKLKFALCCKEIYEGIQLGFNSGLEDESKK